MLLLSAYTFLVPQQEAIALVIPSVTQPNITFPAKPLRVSSLVDSFAVDTSTPTPLFGTASEWDLDWVVTKGKRENCSTSTASMTVRTVITNQLMGQSQMKTFDVLDGITWPRMR